MKNIKKFEEFLKEGFMSKKEINLNDYSDTNTNDEKIAKYILSSLKNNDFTKKGDDIFVDDKLIICESLTSIGVSPLKFGNDWILDASTNMREKILRELINIRKNNK